MRIPRRNDIRPVFGKAFTVIELMVTLTVVGILSALILPAVQGARESARQVHCNNNLRQLGVACLTHHDAQRHFPPGGHGFRWVGDAARGYRREQPGGWVFCVLPYLEQSHVFELARVVVTPADASGPHTALLEFQLRAGDESLRREAKISYYVAEGG